MYSGGDSSGEGVNSIHQFNSFPIPSQSQSAAACVNATNSSGSIDWASLAQQWIQMRDNSGCDPINMPEAPPPPNISGNYNDALSKLKRVSAVPLPTKKFEEKGEADMDMDDDEESNVERFDRAAKLLTSSAKLRNTSTLAAPIDDTAVPQSQWFPGESRQTKAAMVATSLETGATANTQTNAQWNMWPPRVNLPPPTLHIPATPNPTSHIPSLLKLNVTNPKIVTPDSADDATNSNAATMDAAKRKILPAWIREGLEKMEREKQKQLEKQLPPELGDKEDVVKIENSKHDYFNELVKTKTADSDSSGNEEEHHNDGDNSISNVGRMATASATICKSLSDIDESDVDAEQIVGKSYEQKLADLMIIVRKTLTELLLEVTNEEIANIANETVKLHKTKASSAQVIRKSALSSISSITGKLGLAAYDDASNSDSSSDASDKDNDNSDDDENGVDSEEEIKAAIRTKRRAFVKIAEDIEERIAVAASQEEQKLKYYTQLENEQQEAAVAMAAHTSRKDNVQRQKYDGDMPSTSSSSTIRGGDGGGGGKGYDREFGETTTESKLHQSNGRRQRERSARKERTTRFSDNKDSKGSSSATAAAAAAAAAAATYITHAAMHSSAQPTATAITPATSLFHVSAAAAGGTDVNGLYTAQKMSYTTSGDGPSGSGGGGGGVTSTDIAGINSAMTIVQNTLERVAKSKDKDSSKKHQRRDRDEERRQRRRRRRREHRRGSSSNDDNDDENEHANNENDTSSSDSSDDSTTATNSSNNSKYSRPSSLKQRKPRDSDERRRRRTRSRSKGRSYSHRNSTSSSNRQSKRERERYYNDDDDDDDDDGGGDAYGGHDDRHRRHRYDERSDSRRHHSRQHSSTKSRSRSRSTTYSSSSRRRRH